MDVGGIIKFGGHEWQALEIQGSRALIFSKCILEKRSYHASGGTTWEGCILRQYLNTEFYGNNFTEDEKRRILDTRNDNPNNPWYETNGGRETVDKVFLLSLEEVAKYFGDSGQLDNRPSNPTGYIDDKYNSARTARDTDGNAVWWWLRSPGYGSTYAALVDLVGHVYIFGNSVHLVSGGVRPALWLNL